MHPHGMLVWPAAVCCHRPALLPPTLALLQDKSPQREKRRERSSERRSAEPPAKSDAAAPAAGKEKEEGRQGQHAAAERERKLGPRLFDRALQAAVREKRGGEDEAERQRSSKRSRK